jgi:hypothetical protein
MILRTKLRIQDRLRRLTFAGFAGGWLLFGVLCATASATPPPAAATAPAPPQGQASTPAAPASSAKPPATPDESFLEFLGSDDVGDSAWWEFFKKAPPRGSDSPPATPPQDAKK